MFFLIRLMYSKRSEIFLLIIRFAVLVFTIFYLIPFTPFSSANLYQKSLLANAAISALRLHQRLPPFRFSREYLTTVLFEDSAHYLLYSIIFISNYPITLVLLPVSLFALLHSCSFINILYSSGSRGNFIFEKFSSKFIIHSFCQILIGSFGRIIASLVEYQREIFLTIAFTEITLMPTLLFAIIAGLASIFTPFLYYQFLIFRYSSRRNPYTRQAFHLIRISSEKFASSPRCPHIARSFLFKSIELISHLAPQQI